MVAEGRLHDLADPADLHGKGGLLELGDHLPAAKGAQVASAGAGDRLADASDCDWASFILGESKRAAPYFCTSVTPTIVPSVNGPALT